jgi:hypothetical protein
MLGGKLIMSVTPRSVLRYVLMALTCIGKFFMSITPRRGRPKPEVRLSRVAKRIKKSNPITSILLDMFEKALHKGSSSDNTEISRIYNQFIAGKIPMPILRRVVNNYNALPDNVRLLIPPQRAAQLRPVKLSQVTPVWLYTEERLSPAPTPPELDLTSTQVNGFPFDSAYFIKALGQLGELSKDPGPAEVNGFPFDSAYFIKTLGELGGILIAPNPTDLTIDSIHPKLSDGYLPGQSIKLAVRFPSHSSPVFKVILFKEFGPDGLIPYASITPEVLKTVDQNSTSTVLSVTLPEDFETGFVQVTADVFVLFPLGTLKSKRLPIKQELAPPATNVSPILLATPAITSVIPKSQFPGMIVIIEGTNLGDIKVAHPGKLSDGSPQTNASSISFAPIVTLIPSSTQLDKLSLPVTVLKASPVDGLGQLQITIPPDCIPGEYFLRVETGTSKGVLLQPFKFPNGETSIAVDFEVSAHKYKVTFDTILCDDESDPEFGGSDEIVTSWTIVADDKAWGKNTGEYGGFDDGEIQSYSGPDSSVFMTDGSFGAVKIALSIRTDLYESDSSDVAATQAALSATAQASAAVGELLLKLGQPTAGATAIAVAAVAEAASTLAGLFGDSDNLGSLQSTWTAQELQKLTENPMHQFTGQKLAFQNDDDTGSYTLSYTVSRLNVG